MLKVTVTLVLLFNIIYFPEPVRKNLTSQWTSQDIVMQQFLNTKIKAPFEPYLGSASNDHYAKRELRITPYLVGYFLRADAAKLFYLQVVSLFIFVFLSLRVVTDLAKDYVTGILGTVALLFCYVGNSFNFDTLFLDSYAYLGLLAALYFRENIFSSLILLITFFVDERAVLMSAIMPLVSWLHQQRFLGTPEVGWSQQLKVMLLRNQTTWFVLLALASYLALRLFSFMYLDLKTPVGQENGVHFGLALSYGDRVPPALWSALKMNLLLIISAIIVLMQSRQYLAVIWTIGIFFAGLTIAIAVEDVTRSLAYVFPVVFVAYAAMKQAGEQKQVRQVLLILAVINILTPTYTLILDLIRVKPFAWLFLSV